VIGKGKSSSGVGWGERRLAFDFLRMVKVMTADVDREGSTCKTRPSRQPFASRSSVVVGTHTRSNRSDQRWSRQREVASSEKGIWWLAARRQLPRVPALSLSLGRVLTSIPVMETGEMTTRRNVKTVGLLARCAGVCASVRRTARKLAR
jgi:hypothetical protein